ncbi:unnamed protein product [Rhizoctonia solani]|uniref:Uncharacterized protein n=1 Tax=Rhizoctonia solani TaxID=456999 RepID=A0A8H3CAL8_9AGAM|nr:unnamed protein product [Rhizoctonia solani]
MASSTAAGATISLPSFASSFEMTQQRTSPRARSTHSSRSNSREPRPRHYRPYPESNTRGAPRDERSRKRPAPIDEGPDGDGDVGMQSDREQDGDDESSGSSVPAVKEEQVSDVEQSPSPPPTPAAGGKLPARYGHALPQPNAQSQFGPTPPASARRVSPPHITLPTLPQQHRDSNLTLPPMLNTPPEPHPYQHHGEPALARKRRRVTISGVAAGSQAAPRPLHRTVLERANNGYAQAHNPPPPGSSATPATPTAMSGMVSPVVTPGFNMNSPGAIAQVRDTIAIRLEQKALIEQRKNGGAASVSVTTPHTRTAPQPPAPIARTQSSPAGQTTALPPPTSTSPLHTTITPPTLPPPTPTVLTGPPPQTQTLAHRRGKASNKLTIHTPNSSISSIPGVPNVSTAGLGLSGTNSLAGPPAPGARLGLPAIEAAIRSAPPNITKFNPAHIQRPQPPAPPAPQPPRITQAPTPLKERSVSIRRLHTNSTAAQTAPPAPLAIVAPGQPLTLNAPAPPSSYIATPTRTQFPPHTPHPQPPRTARPPMSPPISRNTFMAFYDAYAEVHTLRAQVERMEREMDRRVELAVREMREEIRLLREEIRRGRERDVGYPPDAAYPPYHREREHAHPREPAYGRDRDPSFTRERGDSTYARDWDRRRAGSTSVNQSPMQLDKRPLHSDKVYVDKPIERPVLPGPADRLPPPPGERIPGPGERVVGPGDRIVGPGERISHSAPVPAPAPAPAPTSVEKLHAHPPRSAMRKSPSGRVLPSSLSPPSRAPSVGATGGTPGPGPGSGPGSETGARTHAKARARTNSPGGAASGDKSGSG